MTNGATTASVDSMQPMSSYFLADEDSLQLSHVHRAWVENLVTDRPPQRTEDEASPRPTPIFPREALFSSEEMAREKAWQQRLDELKEMRFLQNDWDENDAVAPLPNVVETAVTYLSREAQEGNPPPDYLAAMPSGSILVEWRGSFGRVEAEISEPGKVELMHVEEGKLTWFEEFPVGRLGD